MNQSATKYTLVLLFIGFISLQSVSVFSQVVVGGETPDPSAALDIQGAGMGFLFPKLTTAERNAISSPATGLIIYNTTTLCLEVNTGTPSSPEWVRSSCKPGVVSSIDCAGSTFTGTLMRDANTSGASLSVPYTGGNGYWFIGQSVTSTGVTGLTATAQPVLLANGSGSITYNITGTPASLGTATFALSAGGQTCNVSLSVTSFLGLASTVSCSGATLTGTLWSGVPASSVSVSVPYTGGNGGAYPAQTISSTGVTGLTATLSAGTFASGAGNLTYTISGTPATAGTASFALNIGGQSCTLSVSVALTGTVSTLNCAGASVTGTLRSGQAASGVSASVPYTGGNGGVHTGQTVTSTGVTGLTATLSAGTFASGAGNLTYTISGTPATSGTASFALNIGGQSCTLSVSVALTGTVSTLNCAGASVTGTLRSGQAASGVSASVPYTGGNGGVHTGQTVTSTGVTGLTATLSAGTFASGAGNLTYTISGTPATSGTASFALNIGGQSCTLSVSVALTGTVSTLNCAGASVTGTLRSGQAASGVSASVPYTGGNGGVHTGQTVTSTGVTGLTATLSAGTFASGAGNLTYTISGTPATSGTASFALNIGGQSCTLSVSVALTGTVSTLNCAGASVTGTLRSGQAASGVSVSVPYTGGNGGVHTGQTVNSTGVTGLTATLAAGTFASGAGNLTYNITGTPASAGTATFALSIGGQACNLNVPVSYVCKAKINATTDRYFMCHNLGAANTSAYPFTPSWEINGGYWQWGRSAEAAPGPTGSGAGQANDGAITGWTTTYAGNGSWADGSKTPNDPCPSGFRVPTKAQWDGVVANNTPTNVGTFSNSATNYSAGKKFGDYLMLPVAGYRYSGDGSLGNRGSYSSYVCSTEYGTDSAWNLFFDDNGAGTSNGYRTNGFSVRCIAE